MSDSALMIYDLKQKLKSIEERIAIIKRRLKDAPSGNLRISSHGNYNQYYLRTTPDDRLGTYLPHKDHFIAERLAQKDYDNKVLAELYKQQKAIERFLKEYDPEAEQKVYGKLSEQRKALVTKDYLTDEEYVEQWLNEPYEKMGFNAFDPEYYTTRGDRVRSKSEILIADALYRHNIPYRYEYPVYDGVVLIGVPDFNCLNVRHRKDYYWEHLGMLGDEGYADRNVKKLEKYSLAERFDESRLILTFETGAHPLNTKVIDEKIRRYLL